jgi:RHS repeat-associated protein
MRNDFLYLPPLKRTDSIPFNSFDAQFAAREIEAYRYGFNGKELDKPGMGGGQSTYDYGFRIYNPAIAKFLSVDPLTKEYPWYTPYQFAGNKPIWAIDLDGLEEYTYDLKYKDADFTKPIITNWRVEENAWLKDPIRGNYVSYIAHITYNNETYTFKESWSETHITDEFIKDPNNPKWHIFSATGNAEMRAIIEAASILGVVKYIAFKSNSTTKPKTEEKADQQGTYAPERPLPRNKDGTPKPDNEATGNPHTQLGKNRDGKNNQSREFDKNGKPVKDVDWTDHNRPGIHPKPHQHRYFENKTGGTLRRGPSEQLK